MTKASFIDELENCRHDFYSMPDRSRPTTYHSLLAPSTEMSVLLPAYDKEMAAVLTALWDNETRFQETRRHSKSVDIENPSLNLLAGAQPAYLAELFTERVWNTGLCRRLLLIHGTKQPEHDPFLNVPTSELITSRLKSATEYLSRQQGQITWHPAASHAYRSWSMNGQQPLPTHPKLENYNGSRKELLIKLMIISAYSANNPSLHLSDFNRATQWLFSAEDEMPSIFSDMAGESDKHIIFETEAFILREYNNPDNHQQPISYTRVWNFLTERAGVQKAYQIMQTLEDGGKVTREAGTNAWRPILHIQQHPMFTGSA
jgi:hypothetical protein